MQFKIVIGYELYIHYNRDIINIFFLDSCPIDGLWNIDIYAYSHRNVISFGNANVYTSIYIFLIRISNEVFFFRQVYVIPIRDYEILQGETHLDIFYYREYYSFKLFKCSNVYHRKFYDSFIRVRPMKS